MKQLNLFVVILFFTKGTIMAQPNLEITTPTGCETGSCVIDFPANPVEAGLNGKTTVTLSNIGTGSSLTGTLQIISATGIPTTPCSECDDYFSLNISSFSVGPGLTQDIEIDFAPPLDIGSDADITVRLRIFVDNDLPPCDPDPSICAAGHPIYTDADPSTLDLETDIIVNAEVEIPAINYSLVIDRSGSMSANVPGTGSKRIELLAEAINYFLSLGELRIGKDSVGMIKYDDVVENYLNLDLLTSAHLTNARANVNTDPLTPPVSTTSEAYIAPRNLTAIGDAVKMAVDQLNGSNPLKNVVILFSDGYENAGTLRLDDFSDLNDVKLYTIGLGNSVNDDLLREYSSLSLTGSPGYNGFDGTEAAADSDLKKIYLDVYVNELGLVLIDDPLYMVNLADFKTKRLGNVRVTSSDKKILFSIIFPRNLNDVIQFEIVGPDGTTLPDGSSSNFLTKRIDQKDHSVYEVLIKEKAIPSAYVGSWYLRVVPDSVAMTSTRKIRDSNTEFSQDRELQDWKKIPISFDAAAFSNLKFDLAGAIPGNTPGNELTVSVSATEFGIEVDSIKEIDVQLQTPDKKSRKLNLSQDEFGYYRASFPHTYDKGLYSITARALVANRKGEVASRYASTDIYVSDYQPVVEASDVCLPCYWTKMVIIISIVLLLLIVILLLRRRAT